MNIKKWLLTELKGLKENGPKHVALGICDCIRIKDIKNEKLKRAEMSRLFRLWPKFSGDIVYPVPHPTKTPSYAYNEEDVWDAQTVYGQNRRELLDWMIATLEKEEQNGE